MRKMVTIFALTVTAACAVRPIADDLMFLTRDGCANARRFRQSLDGALGRLDQARTYRVVHQDTLPTDDWRRGYPTPTLLYKGQDVFGLPEPTRPFPEAT